MRAGAAQRGHDGPSLTQRSLRAAAASCALLVACSLGAGGGGAPLTPPSVCSGDATACLVGTVKASGFQAPPARFQAQIFRELPVAGATPIATSLVGSDGSWAFSDLPAWGHYFVQAGADFGGQVAVGAVAGPLTVPPTPGASTDIVIKPVQLTIVQQASAGGTMQLQQALAYVWNPVDGSPAKGASVTIAAGGSAVAMQESAQGGAEAYTAVFSPLAAAQSAYTVTAVMPGSTSPTTWHAAAGSAAFTPTLTAPVANATVPQGQPLAVSWPVQASADEELVVLYSQQQGAWAQKYQSPRPNDQDATAETIPGSYVGAGTLLVNVLFSAAHCPTDQDGCVVNDETAAVQITAQ